jgi:hypothetical protein
MPSSPPHGVPAPILVELLAVVVLLSETRRRHARERERARHLEARAAFRRAGEELAHAKP